VQLSHFYEVSQAPDVSTLERRLVDMASRMDFGLVTAMMVVEAPGEGHSASVQQIGNTPQAYKEAQQDPTAGARDPVLALFKSLSVPFTYDRSLYAGAGAIDLWEEQALYGYKTGLGVSLHLPDRQHFALGMDRDTPLPTDEVALARLMADLQLLAMHAHAASHRLMLPSLLPAMPKLSKREVEVLHWASAGKTAWETGRILGISEEGVNYHVRSIMRKLDVPTKQQGVLRAVALGLIAL